MRADLPAGGDHGAAVERVADEREHVLGERPLDAVWPAQTARGPPPESDVLRDLLDDPGAACAGDGEVPPDDDADVR